MNPEDDNSPVTLDMAAASVARGVANESQQTQLTHVQLIPYYLACLAVAAVPWIAILSLRSQSYHEGLSFQKGLHVFGDLLGVFKNFMLTCGILLVAIVGTGFVPKSVRRQLSTLFAMTCFITFMSSLLTPCWCNSAFEQGRAAAYQATNVPKLVVACEVLHKRYMAAKDKSAFEWYAPQNGTLKRVPKTIRDLNPTDVIVGSRGVVIKMDGGGIAAHEAYFLPIGTLPMSADAFAQLHRMNIISRNPPVFWNRSYDCRTLPYD